MTPTFNITEVERKRIEDSQKIIERLMHFQLPYNHKRAELYRHFIGHAPARYFPDGKTRRSSVFVPYPYANVRYVRDTVIGGLFGQEPPFEALPRGSRDEMAALAMQRVLELKMLREAKLRTVMSEFVTGLAIYGFYGIRCEWDWDYDLIPAWEEQIETTGDGLPILNPSTGMPNLVRRRTTKKIPRQRPKYTPIDVYDLLVDPDGAHLAVLFDKTLPQMRRENESSLVATGLPIYDPEGLVKIQRHIQSTSDDPVNSVIRLGELWDVTNGSFTLLTVKEDLEVLARKDDRHANRAASYQQYRRDTTHPPSIWLGGGENQYLHRRVPILYSNYTKLPGEIIGMGIIEPSYNINEHLNRFFSTLADNWDLGINQRLLVDTTRNIDLYDVQENNVPGGIIPVQGNVNEAFGTVPVHTPTAGDYQIAGFYRNLIEIVSSVSDPYARGVGSPTGNKTATGIQSVIQQSTQGITQLAYQLEVEILEPLTAMTASMCQQYLTDDVEIMITDELPAIPKVNSHFVRISPEQLAGNFDFRFVGSAYMDHPFVKQRNLMGVLNLLMTSPYVKPFELIHEVLRVMRVPNPGQFIVSKPEAQIMQQQMQQMQMQAQVQQQMQAQQGGAAPGGRRVAQFEGMQGAPEGQVRQQAQAQGANALGMGGVSEAPV